MLKKLFKYEFKDLVKYIKFTWFGILGIAVLTSVSLLLTVNIVVNPGDSTTSLLLTLFSTGSSSLMLIGLSVVMLITLVLFVVRFYRSMLSNEGYLTHSLPFSADQLLNVKLLCGVLIFIIDVAIMAVAVIVAVLPTLLTQATIGEALRAIFILIGEIYKNLGVGYGIALTFEAVLIAIISVFTSCLFPVFCMSIGQRFKNRIVVSVILYIGIQWGLQMIGSFAWFVLMIVSMMGGLPALEDLAFLPTVTVIGAVVIVFEAAAALVFYFVSRKMLTKKLNLV
ncbi:MAG: hypothetical protein K6F14_04335 [Clostridiales bacterium]|nr:hypothetical protein [Clostridiales bacterium]